MIIRQLKLMLASCKFRLFRLRLSEDIAEVRMYGNKKYGDPDNWKTVELRRYVDALLRHTLAFVDDNGSKDCESGIEHYKHMACNMAFICEIMSGRIPQKCKTIQEIVDREG